MIMYNVMEILKDCFDWLSVDGQMDNSISRGVAGSPNVLSTSAAVEDA